MGKRIRRAGGGYGNEVAAEGFLEKKKFSKDLN